MKTKRQRDDMFKKLREYNCQPKILYLVKIAFKDKGKTKTFLDK